MNKSNYYFSCIFLPSLPFVSSTLRPDFSTETVSGAAAVSVAVSSPAAAVSVQPGERAARPAAERWATPGVWTCRTLRAWRAWIPPIYCGLCYSDRFCTARGSRTECPVVCPTTHQLKKCLLLVYCTSRVCRDAERASEERAPTTGGSLLRPQHHGGGQAAPNKGKTHTHTHDTGGRSVCVWGRNYDFLQDIIQSENMLCHTFHSLQSATETRQSCNSVLPMRTANFLNNTMANYTVVNIVLHFLSVCSFLFFPIEQCVVFKSHTIVLLVQYEHLSVSPVI